MRKAVYKGGHLSFGPGTICDVRLVWDDDCGYVYIWILGKNIKCSYEGKVEMEKEWQLI